MSRMNSLTKTMQTKRRLMIAGMLLGGLLMMAPMFGLAGTIFGMSRAFHSLSASGIGDPPALANAIGTTLTSTMIGLVLCPIGIVLLIISSVLLFKLPKPTPSSESKQA